jgi:TolB protein
MYSGQRATRRIGRRKRSEETHREMAARSRFQRRSSWSLILAAGLLAVVGLPSVAHAAFPGESGSVAFVSDRDGNAEVYTMSADGSDVTRLTSNPAADSAPAFSPDGQRIAFTSTRDGNPEIYTMSADGSDVTRLTSNSTADIQPAWSPDGQRIAFVRTPPPSPFPGRPVHETFTITPDGSDLTRLTNNTADASPNFSPDGQRIAFSRNLFRHQKIHTMAADGSDQISITNNISGGCRDFIDDLSPAFSPDGERIAFASNREDVAGPCYSPNFEIYTVAPDGSGVVRLTNNAASDGDPDWQPLRRPPHGPGVGREACKKGGWKELGFRNQGQCVEVANAAANVG